MSCQMCQEAPARYTCPRCQLKSCCLDCVRRHKDETGCNGVREKTAFVAVQEFTDMALLSDYRFLEEGGRKVDNASRHNTRKREKPSKNVQKLVTQAKKRRISLRLLPHSFTKRRTNSSAYWTQDKGIRWHIEWLFPQAEAKYTNKRVPENTTLEDALKNYIHPTESDPVIRQKLKKYVSVGMEACRLCLPVEGRPVNSPRYHVLDWKKTLAENLSGKEIVEYPSIHVVLPSQLSLYPVLADKADSPSEEKSNSKDII